MASNILSKIRLFFAVILASFLFSLPCFADGSTISLKADKTDLSPGDEITLTADLSDDTKIYALTATLQYDQNVFEPITDNNFTVSSTETVQYNSENNQFGIINQSGAVSDDFLTVRLRVKEDTNVGDTNIALTNITTSDGQTKTSYSTASTKVLVAKDATEGETIPTSQENAIIEQQTPAQSVLSATPFVIIALIVVGIIVLVAILHFGNLTPNTSKLYYSLICLGAVIAVLIGAITIINNSKKDVNGDGNIDYGDATKVVDYLINLEGSSDQNQDNDSSNSKNNGQTSASYQKMPYIPSQNAGRYDINNDGQVDISDAAHVTENVTKETKASLKNSDDQSAYV